MMGHASTANLNRLDMPRGTYDNAPWIYSSVEKEYEKLEPYINIYSGKRETSGLTQEEVVELKKLIKLLDSGKYEITAIKD